MQDIAAGKNMDDIISKCNDDNGFVKLWFTYLKANDWIEFLFSISEILSLLVENRQD
jgi:hypothetical protein